MLTRKMLDVNKTGWRIMMLQSRLMAPPRSVPPRRPVTLRGRCLEVLGKAYTSSMTMACMATLQGRLVSIPYNLCVDVGVSVGARS